jgi:hypothetical protein
MSKQPVWPLETLTKEQAEVVKKFGSVVESWKGKIGDEEYELAINEITLFRFPFFRLNFFLDIVTVTHGNWKIQRNF